MQPDPNSVITPSERIESGTDETGSSTVIDLHQPSTMLKHKPMNGHVLLICHGSYQDIHDQNIYILHSISFIQRITWSNVYNEIYYQPGDMSSMALEIYNIDVSVLVAQCLGD